MRSPVKLVKSFWAYGKVGGLYGRALKLEKQDRFKEAYAVMSDALSILFDLQDNSPPFIAMIVVFTTFLDRMALKMGTPDITATAMVKALEHCRLAGLENPAPDDGLKEYIDWIKYRVRQQEGL